MKPFELIPITDDDSDTIEYICQYVVMGKCNQKVLTSINGIDITLNESNHPATNIKEDHFVIDFGPISLHKTEHIFLWAKHLSISERIDAINYVLNKYDPAQLIPLGSSPKDEYKNVSIDIAKIMNVSNFFKTCKGVFNIFKYNLDITLSKREILQIVNNIHIEIDYNIFYKELKTCKELENIERHNEYDFKFKIHNGFIVTTKDRFTYINDKKFYDVEDIDLKECFIDFVNNENVVYIQLRKKPLFSTSYYFRIKSKQHFKLSNYVNKKNVELIFDNKSILYDGRDTTNNSSTYYDNPNNIDFNDFKKRIINIYANEVAKEKI